MPLVIPVSRLRFFSVFPISILLTIQPNLSRCSTWDSSAWDVVFQYIFLSLFLDLMLYKENLNAVVIAVEDASS